MRNSDLETSAYVGLDVFPELQYGFHFFRGSRAILGLTGWARPKPKPHLPKKVFA
jgi:hypothetical protein